MKGLARERHIADAGATDPGEVERHARYRGVRKVREVRSDRLGELVMNELRQLDTIAYVRFASVYKRFEDVSEFEDVLEEFRRAAPRKTSPRKR